VDDSPSPSPEAGDRLIVIGQVTRPQGRRGELRVTPLTDDPRRFERLSTCVLWDAALDRREPHHVRRARCQGDGVILALAGCETLETAAGLAGRLVAIPESEVLPPGPGRFYPWQLTGARVLTEDGRAVGVLARINPGPAHDLWVVHAPGREHLIPAVPEIVREVDPAEGRVVIRPPEGLLDL
jgi:16S rRNA processing protein RimM